MVRFPALIAKEMWSQVSAYLLIYEVTFSSVSFLVLLHLKNSSAPLHFESCLSRS